QRAYRRHVRTHDSVPALRHPLDRVHRAHRLNAEPEEDDTQLRAHAHDLVDVLNELLVRAMDARALFSAELELPSGLDRDVRGTPCQGYEAAMPALRLPAEPLCEPLEHGLDASLPTEGRGNATFLEDADLLVLGSDAPFRRWLGPGRDVANQ